MKEMTRHEWLNYGIINGYCSLTFCEHHEGFPYSEAEMENEDIGDDCIIGIRYFSDAEERDAVMRNQPGAAHLFGIA